MADWTAPHLSSFLQDLRAHTGKRTVHLVAHSMGSRILSVALDRLSLTQPKTIDHFQEVVLAAPDINTKVLSQLSVALRSEADRVTIYASGRDRALQFSDFLRTFWRERSPRVGSKATEINLPQFDIIDATRARFSLIGHSTLLKTRCS